MLEGGDRNIKFLLIKTVVLICIIILIISSGILLKNFVEYKDTTNSNIELIENVVIKESEQEEFNIDWSKLERVNEDIIAWIKIDNTNINYPILKDTDKLRYLKHSFDGKYNSNGSIFTLNNNPLEEKVTTIYGHNTKSGIMFSNLSKYMDKKFLYEHSTFKIYSKNQNYEAKVFSCYSIGIDVEENNIKSLDFDEEIEYYKKMSKHSIEDIGEVNRIVKLSTCSYLNSNTIPTDQRYYIIACLKEYD